MVEGRDRRGIVGGVNMAGKLKHIIELSLFQILKIFRNSKVDGGCIGIWVEDEWGVGGVRE